MKLLYLVSEDWYFYSHRLALAKAAKAQGFDVSVATRCHDLKEKIEAEGIHVIPLLKYRRRSLSGLLAGIFEVRQTIKEQQPDMIHAIALLPIGVSLIARGFRKKPEIIGTIAGLGQGFISNKTIHRILRFCLVGAMKILLKKTDHLIFQNVDDMAFLGGRLPHIPQTFIAGSGVDLTVFKPSPEPASPPIKVALVARMLAHKGIVEFVDAAKIIQASHPDIQMILVGAPDLGAPTSISEAQLQAWQAEGLIEYQGARSDIAEVWRQCHIAVLPSYSEGVPKSLLEAAACGRPLIATDVAGNRAICLDGQNGLLVPAKDPAALAAAIIQLATDPEARRTYGQASHAIVEAAFSLEIVLEKTLKVYN